MKAYNPASSVAWSRSASRDFKKPAEKADSMSSYMNSVGVDKPLNQTTLMIISGLGEKRMNSIMKMLCCQNKLYKRHSRDRFKYCRRSSISSSDIIEASTY